MISLEEWQLKFLLRVVIPDEMKTPNQLMPLSYRVGLFSVRAYLLFFSGIIISYVCRMNEEYPEQHEKFLFEEEKFLFEEKRNPDGSFKKIASKYEWERVRHFIKDNMVLP